MTTVLAPPRPRDIRANLSSTIRDQASPVPQGSGMAREWCTTRRTTTVEGHAVANDGTANHDTDGHEAPRRAVRSALRPSLRWLAQQLDTFAGEFVRSAGSTTGKAIGLGVGLYVSHKLIALPDLLTSLRQGLGL